MEDIKQENYQTNNEVIQLLEHSYNNIYQYQVCADMKQVYPETFESETGHGPWNLISLGSDSYRTQR